MKHSLGYYFIFLFAFSGYASAFDNSVPLEEENYPHLDELSPSQQEFALSLAQFFFNKQLENMQGECQLASNGMSNYRRVQLSPENYAALRATFCFEKFSDERLS
jgi:hypothetical protein